MTRSDNISVQCSAIEDKRQVVYNVRVDGSVPMQKMFADFEKLHDKTKHLLPSHISGPPKKKFFNFDNKLTEKRRAWIETITSNLLRNHSQNQYVQNFFSPVLSDQNDVYLGPSERKSARPDHFEYLTTIGKGSFGQVFLVRHLQDRNIYAMKVLHKDHIKKRNEVQHVMAERNVLISNVDHPFLVSLHYSFQNEGKLYFVLDYLNGGELFCHIQRDKQFKESRARFYAAEIASALGYLHGLNIIYRQAQYYSDLKGHVVLTDFGLCKEGIRPNDTTETFCGTPEYLAPEPPFYSQDRREMYDRIINQKLSISPLATPSSRDILTHLLQKDRTKRLGCLHDFKEIQSHPFFKEIDWIKLERREIKPEFVPPVKDEFDMTFIDSEFTKDRPNPASLIPPSGLSHQDLDFLGFTYCNRNNLDGEKDDRRA
ncbi:hypothetical protein QR680_001869 [Steinernema hermaphroditum]|uniref:Protein kinase domain-containing protein n=1 Tax=Steinernema hermaphroditum TaxID=289476 RepID=A0AA39H0B4_9BILA|nr:hypothetical protein QR680_001869 [Steinernema hermaphroditum]